MYNGVRLVALIRDIKSLLEAILRMNHDLSLSEIHASACLVVVRKGAPLENALLRVQFYRCDTDSAMVRRF